MRWLKRLAGALALVAVLLGLGAFIYWDAVRFLIAVATVTPAEPFAEAAIPPAYDYASDEAWVALPGRTDNADFIPSGETDAQASAPVDVFFVHPTTYISAANWNETRGDATGTERLELGVMRGQASAFNGCCRVYAPRYRQATFAAFVDRTGSGEKALALAYGDVAAAFDRYLAHFNEGRPFILAGHSQGSRHLFRLLRETISRTPLRDRLIAAYPIGIPESRQAFAEAAPDIPVCARPLETGCLVTWNAVGPEVAHFRDASGDICVNPLTWMDDAAPADFARNQGSLSITRQALFPGIADATCAGGQLVVSEIRSDIYRDVPRLLGHDNHHILDYGLFWANLRANAIARTQAFLDAAE